MRANVGAKQGIILGVYAPILRKRKTDCDSIYPSRGGARELGKSLTSKGEFCFAKKNMGLSIDQQTKLLQMYLQ